MTDRVGRLASPVSAKAWQRQPPKSIWRRAQLRHGSGIQSVPRKLERGEIRQISPANGRCTTGMRPRSSAACTAAPSPRGHVERAPAPAADAGLREPRVESARRRRSRYCLMRRAQCLDLGRRRARPARRSASRGAGLQRPAMILHVRHSKRVAPTPARGQPLVDGRCRRGASPRWRSARSRAALPRKRAPACGRRRPRSRRCGRRRRLGVLDRDLHVVEAGIGERGEHFGVTPTPDVIRSCRARRRAPPP